MRQIGRTSEWGEDTRIVESGFAVFCIEVTSDRGVGTGRFVVS
jgi:hypothetical protein